MEDIRDEVQGTEAKGENKSERFIRLAQNRVTKARVAISKISYLSNRGSYEYTSEQVEQMFAVLEQELAQVKSEFLGTGKEKKEKKFSFQ